MITNKKKPLDLNSGAFDILLEALDSDRTLAGEKYEQIRQAVITFFTFRGAPDPLELSDIVFDRVMGRLQEGAAVLDNEPIRYFYGVARNVWREVRIRPAAFVALDGYASLDHEIRVDPQEQWLQIETANQIEQRLQCLEYCLQQLSPRDRDLIIAYYQGTGSAKIENRQKLAAQFGISLKTLRNKTTQLRNQLSECGKKCLKNRKNKSS